MEIDPVASGMSMFASQYDENLAAFNTPPVGWLERYRAAYRAQKEGWSNLLFGAPASPLPGVPPGVPPPPAVARASAVERFWPVDTKYPPWPAQVPPVIETAVGAVSSLGLPTEDYDAPLTPHQMAVALSYHREPPHPDRVWFATVYDAQLKRRISLATTKLWEYFTFPLMDRAGVFHYSRLATPWIYYKDLNVYDLFEAFVTPVVTAGVIASAAWVLGTWAPGFLVALAAPALAEKCLRALTNAVTNLIKRKVRVPREIRDALAITSADVYDGSLRTRLPALTASYEPLSDYRNLAHQYPINLFSQRGMNKTVTFRSVRPCH